MVTTAYSAGEIVALLWPEDSFSLAAIGREENDGFSKDDAPKG